MIESEERSTDSDEPDGCIKQRTFGPELWHDVVVQEVEKKELHNAFKDGRRWNKNCPTKCKGHALVRYADCRGSYVCTNDNCPYKVHYRVINKTQFKTSGNQCKICGSDGEYVPCRAQ